MCYRYLCEHMLPLNLDENIFKSVSLQKNCRIWEIFLVILHIITVKWQWLKHQPRRVGVGPGTADIKRARTLRGIRCLVMKQTLLLLCEVIRPRYMITGNSEWAAICLPRDGLCQQHSRLNSVCSWQTVAFWVCCSSVVCRRFVRVGRPT